MLWPMKKQRATDTEATNKQQLIQLYGHYLQLCQYQSCIFWETSGRISTLIPSWLFYYNCIVVVYKPDYIPLMIYSPSRPLSPLPEQPEQPDSALDHLHPPLLERLQPLTLTHPSVTAFLLAFFMQHDHLFTLWKKMNKQCSEKRMTARGQTNGTGRFRTRLSRSRGPGRLVNHFKLSLCFMRVKVNFSSQQPDMSLISTMFRKQRAWFKAWDLFYFLLVKAHKVSHTSTWPQLLHYWIQVRRIKRSFRNICRTKK